MKFVSKKIAIEAFEIKEIQLNPAGGYIFISTDAAGVAGLVGATAAQCGAHTPAIGDFFIMRPDGDNYLCPAKVFHEKYEGEPTAKSSLQKSDDEAAAVQKTPNRVTLESIEDKIVTVEYLNPATVPHFTMAIMRMLNGYVVTGQSAPADPKNFDEALGRKFAREDAIRKVWALEGYLLCQKISEGAV